MDLHELERAEILSACGAAEMVRLKPGEFLFREDDEARCLYIVKSGTLRVMSGSTVYETLRAGAIVGEMAIIEADMPRSATVIAGTHAELAAIDLDKFLELVSNAPRFALTVMRVITRRLRVMNQRARAGHGA
jgi:CRP/FNR family cyclic AMP-dependent transcriptional regulator